MSIKNEPINLSVSNAFKNLLNVGEKAFKHLHNKGSYNPKDLATEKPYLDLINKTFDVLNLAVTDNEMPEVMRKALQNDAYLFGGLKVHAQLTEAKGLLLKADGTQKTFSQVSHEFDKLNNNYNINYLQSEYQFATSSAQMAAKWAGLDDSDRYNLQYRTAGDNRVRAEHNALRDTTLPKNDPFWGSYYPPNGWKCRCTVIEVLKDKYPTSNSADAIAKGETATTKIGKNGKNGLEIFRFNPGITKTLMPPKHPYNKVVGANVVKDKLKKPIEYKNISVDDLKVVYKNQKINTEL